MEEDGFKYTEDGQQVMVLEKISDTVHRIQFVYEHEDREEPYFGNTKLWDKLLFDSPPLPKLHELAAKLEAQIDKDRETRKQLDSEVKKLREQKAALENEFRSIPGLQNIVDFLKNPPTHFICQRYHYPHIVPVDKCKVDYSHLADLGIQTSYGLKEPQAVWYIKIKKENSWDYSDQMSGIPCNGEEDAKVKLKSELQKWFDKNPLHNSRDIDTVIMLRENGVDVPESCLNAHIASLEQEYKKIGLDVDAQKAKKLGEIDKWNTLLEASKASKKEA